MRRWEHSHFADCRLNPAQFIDYSTEPKFHRERLHQFLLTDVSETIENYMRYPNMEEFYRFFPLHEIIEMLLSVSPNEFNNPGKEDYRLFVTEERLGNKLQQIDFDLIFMLYESLTFDLEQEISTNCPAYVTSGDYVFYRWVDSRSLCLCLADHHVRNVRNVKICLG